MLEDLGHTDAQRLREVFRKILSLHRISSVQVNSEYNRVLHKGRALDQILFRRQGYTRPTFLSVHSQPPAWKYVHFRVR